MASSSTDPLGLLNHQDDDDNDNAEDNPSLLLARRLQEEEDALLALQLSETTEAAPANRVHGTGQRNGCSGNGGRLPGERLASAAHSSVQHLGRNTAKKIERFLEVKSLTLEALLRAFNDASRRSEILGLIDAGQRERCEAELVALSIDFDLSSELT